MAGISKSQIESVRSELDSVNAQLTVVKKQQDQHVKRARLYRNCLIGAGVVIVVLAVLLLWRPKRKTIGNADVQQLERDMAHKALQAASAKRAGEDSILIQKVDNQKTRDVIIIRERDENINHTYSLDDDELIRAFNNIERHPYTPPKE